MRTTVSISDELLEAARRRARSTGRTLGAVLESALRRELSVAPPAERPNVPVFRGGSGSKSGIDMTSNAALHEALSEGVSQGHQR